MEPVTVVLSNGTVCALLATEAARLMGRVGKIGASLEIIILPGGGYEARVTLQEPFPDKPTYGT